MDWFINFLAGIAESGKEVVEAKVETIYSLGFAWLHSKVEASTNTLDNKGELILKLALRDKLIKELPLETYPLD